MPSHHPEAEELLAYAVGGGDGWLSVLIACHLTLCPSCRQELALFEAVGGALLEDLEGAVTEGAAAPRPLVNPTARLVPAPAHGQVSPAVQVPQEIARSVPRPLHAFFADSHPRFRLMAPGLYQIPLTLASGERPLRLVRFRPGFVIPEHAHTGLEWLLILSGELIDLSTGQRYARGDVSRRDTPDVHAQRIGDQEPCVAVFAYLGRPVPRTLFGRLLAAIVGL